MPKIKADYPVFDNIYGFVYLTNEERKLIDSPYFHRLRYINQLGMAYYVFPGALHSRFSHSIGVLHIVSQIIENLRRQNYKVDNNTERLLRTAALLHDIAHYPLSHTIEEAYVWFQNYQDKNNEYKLVEHPHPHPIASKVGRPSKLPDFFLFGLTEEERKTKNPASHDNLVGEIILSNPFLRILNEAGFSREDAGLIVSIIKGDWRGDSLSSSIINSLLDADRLDYMVRDAYFTGVKIGGFDVDNIMRKVGIVDQLASGSRKKYKCLGVHIDAIQSIENFLLANYFWYTQIIYHQSVLVFDEIAKHLYFHLIKRGDAPSFDDIKSMVNKPEEFFKFNDRYFWQDIHAFIERKKGPESLLTKMAKALIYRRNPEYIRCSEWPRYNIFRKEIIDAIKDEKIFLEVEGMIADSVFMEDIKNDNTWKYGFIKKKEIYKHDIDMEREPGGKTIRIFDDSGNIRHLKDCQSIFKHFQKNVLRRYAVYDFSPLLNL